MTPGSAGRSDARAEAGAPSRISSRPRVFRLDGDAPCDPRIQDERFYNHVSPRGRSASGRATSTARWDCERARDVLLSASSTAGRAAAESASGATSRASPSARLASRGRRAKAFEIGEHHYDLGNDLFEAMLDPRYATAAATGRMLQPRRRRRTQSSSSSAASSAFEAGHARARHRLRLGRARAATPPSDYGVSRRRCHGLAEQAEFARERCRGLPDRDPPPGLPRAPTSDSTRVLDRHVRARRPQELPPLLRRGAARARGRRPVPAAHDRARVSSTSSIRGSRSTSSPTR